MRGNLVNSTLCISHFKIIHKLI